MKKIITILTIICCVLSLIAPMVHAEVTDQQVLDVISQLEAIDSLQTMQDKRYTYKVSNRTDVANQPAAEMEKHNTARNNYHQYLDEMFAARRVALDAYNALNDEQKALIDSSLVEKLDDTLETVFLDGPYNVTPAVDEYTFEAVDGGAGFGYEVSHYMVAQTIPQTFVLAHTNNNSTSWTPSGKYEYGKSNYDVTYCCDFDNGVVRTTDYKRINLEDSTYYSSSAARHIRGILQHAYPYVTVEEMKEYLKEEGLNESFVDSLNKDDLMSAVQMAIWTYANDESLKKKIPGYFATIDVTKNQGGYFTAMNDHTNECWEWFPTAAKVRSYDAQAEYRVNNLYNFLTQLEPIDAKEYVISDIQVTRASLISHNNGLYNIGMYVYLNNGCEKEDDIIITVTSYHLDDLGNKVISGKTKVRAGSDTQYELAINAKYGDTIVVEVEGTQYIEKDVYFYVPKGGREVSQSLVGVAEGETEVKAVEEFVFEKDIEKGLRIYKTTTTGLPLSDITFNIYNVTNQTISTTPTKEEINQYAIDENKVGSIVTDHTGYGFIDLDDGTYLVIEEYNKNKVKSPIEPFYISVPLAKEVSQEDGNTKVVYEEVVSIYPKNEPVEEEDQPILPPPTQQVKGQFKILKHDINNTEKVLSDAQFKIYRSVTDEEDYQILEINGVQYAVIPVIIDEKELVLITDENGIALSPELESGTYFIEEIMAPDGYNLLNEPISIYLQTNLNNEEQIISIANTPGTHLPSTGGNDYSLFIIGGSILLLGAGVLLVSKKYMKYE